MNAAHGSQVLVSQAVVDALRDACRPTRRCATSAAVRLRDLASPRAVYQLVHPELRHDFPALRSLEATPNNLPQQVTSFIGRERELAESRSCSAATRLLTLLGMGGLGKTRLSLQVAAERHGRLSRRRLVPRPGADPRRRRWSPARRRRCSACARSRAGR